MQLGLVWCSCSCYRFKSNLSNVLYDSTSNKYML